MKIDNQHELIQQTSDHNLELTSDWEGKEVTVHPKITETSKKSETVFKKIKNFMNAAWKAKYKILLSTAGVLTAAATATCLSIFLAKKLNRKALTNAEPKDNQPPVTEGQEIKEEEKVSPRLVHLTLDRPVREGIRRPTSTKLYETLLNQRQVVSEEKIAEPISVQEEEKVSSRLVHLTLDRPVREGIRRPTSSKPYETLLNQRQVVSEEEIAEPISVQKEEEVAEKQPITQTSLVDELVTSDEKIAELLRVIEEEQPTVQHPPVTEQVTSDEKIAELLQVEETKVAEKQQSVDDKPKTEKKVQHERQTVRKQHKTEKKRQAEQARLAKKRHSLVEVVAKMTKRIHKK